MACTRSGRSSPLHIEQEVHHIAVLYNVLFAFDTQFARRFNPDFAPMLVEVGEGVDLGSDEASLKIG